MYQYIKGEIVEKGIDYIVVETGGIGYYMSVSTKTVSELHLGEHAKIYTKLLVKEDDHSLCGFKEINEREFFEQLISVSGIGQRVAMGMISKASYTLILEWILKADEKQLTTLPGLGKKTAQRLIVELRDKLKKRYGSELATLDLSSDALVSRPDEDVLLALMGLGFKRDEIQVMLKDINTSALSIEEIIKYALKQSR